LYARAHEGARGYSRERSNLSAAHSLFRMDTSARIRELNDDLRRAIINYGKDAGPGRLPDVDGFWLISCGIELLPAAEVAAIKRRVAEFDAFTPANDPYGEHDFGSFEHNGRTIFWKIDYYDRMLKMHSPNPADSAVTTRMLTVMLAEEY
jgi:hypothetical protein